VAIPPSSLQQAFRKLELATVGLFLVVVLLAGYVYFSGIAARQRIAEIAHDTNRALCTLRTDLEQRVEQSRNFLEENPDGVPGIPASLIRNGIANQENTIEALSGLDC
jgi:hypothetical protein